MQNVGEEVVFTGDGERGSYRSIQYPIKWNKSPSPIKKSICPRKVYEEVDKRGQVKLKKITAKKLEFGIRKWQTASKYVIDMSGTQQRTHPNWHTMFMKGFRGKTDGSCCT